MSDHANATRIQPKDLRCKERQPLQDIIPLSAPFVIYIDPTNLCNFKCRFCPTGDPALLRKVGRPNGMMTIDLFRKVVSDIQGFGSRLKLLSLYKDGEPLLNSDFPDLVSIARDAGIAERIWTKTNGSRLNPELNRRLAGCGLDLISISVEAVSSQGYLEIAGAKIDYQRFRDHIADLHTRRGRMDIYIKIADSGLSKDQIAKFYADFEPHCTHIGVEKLMGWSLSEVKDFTLGTNPDTYDGLPLVPKEVCAYPFYVLAVNSDGSVSLCGNDWSHGTVVGDVKQESLLDIWHGERLHRFRQAMLGGRRCDLAACANCYYLKIVPDNLDAHASMLQERLQAAWDSRNGGQVRSSV